MNADRHYFVVADYPHDRFRRGDVISTHRTYEAALQAKRSGYDCFRAIRPGAELVHETLQQLAGILGDVYGATLNNASPCTLLWAAARCRDPRLALSVANDWRHEHGLPLAYADGDATFK